jgi:hypothetical protein
MLSIPWAITLELAQQFYGKVKIKVDGHCVQCGREATFDVHGNYLTNPSDWGKIAKRHALDDVSIECTRNEHHSARYWFLIRNMVVQKVGQYPSLADIANDEVKIYRKLMPPDMAAEFHKAVGLAAHGVGVGSFVYLRRIFERLINRRFDEFKAVEGWDETAFRQDRMEDKIATLRGRLPEFLVQNRKIYSILSSGIHELSEEACLGYFDVMRHSIIMILEDDRKAREERERREVFTRTIAGFKPPTTDEVGHS